MENKITINSLASTIAQTTGKTKKLSEDFLREFFKVVSENLENGESIRIKGFGTFKIVDMESRTGVNVNTGEKQEIAPYKKVVFTPAKELAGVINAPFEEFESVEIDDEMPEEYLEPEEILEEEVVEYDRVMDEEPDETLRDEDKLSDEDKVSNYRLEEGSDEEGEDDEITYEAYTEKEEVPESMMEETQSPVMAIDNGGILNEQKESVREENMVEEEESHGHRRHRRRIYYEEPEPKSRFGIGFLVGSLCTLVVCVVIFMLGCFFDWWPVSFGSGSQRMKEISRQEIPVETQQVTQSEPEIAEETPEPVYDTVSTTRYLTTIAREHYGNFNFWPYIYMENESILGHPDRITPGTKVVVPDLSKYGVDPNNKDDVAAAKQKAAEIYAKFK